MGAVRLRIDAVGGHTGINWKVDIFDEDYASTVNAVTGRDLEIKWDREGDDILTNIKGSEATIVCYNETAAFDSFLTDLNSAYEKKFKMVIYQDGTLFWAGVLVHDVVEYENLSKPREFQLRAVDGLARLKDVEFAEVLSGAYSDQNTLLKYIMDCLEYNDLSQFWGAAEAYVRESIEWYDTQVVTPGAGDSPLLKTRADKRTFLKDPSSGTPDGDDEPYSCYEVIESILKLFAARIIHVNGAYYIQQVRNFDGANYTERVIYKGSSPSVASNSSVTHAQTEGSHIRLLGGGSYSYMPPLHQSRVTTAPHEFIITTNDTVVVNGTTTTDNTSLDLGTLRNGASDNRTLLINCHIRQGGYGDPAQHSNLKLKVEFKLSAGTNRIKGDSGTSTITWTTTAADVVTRYIEKPSLVNFITAIAFQTPELPFTSQTGCTLTVTLTLERRNTGISYPADAEMNFTLFDIRVLALEDGQPYRTSTYEVDNPTDSTNSVVFDLGELAFTDTGQTSSVTALEVNSTGSTWVESAVWDAGFDADVSLAQSVVIEAMALQKEPVPLYRGSFTGKLDGTHPAPLPHKTITYDSTTYVFNGGSFKAKMDEFRGEWFELLITKTGISAGLIQQDKRPLSDQLQGPELTNERDPDTDGEAKFLTRTNAAYAPSGGAITSITIVAPGHTNIKDNDTIYILNPYTLYPLDSFTVNGDVGSSATSITVDSQTPAYYLPVACPIIHNPNDFISVTDGRVTNDLTVGNDITASGDVQAVNMNATTQTSTPKILFDGTATIPTGDSDTGQGTGIFIADGQYLYLDTGSGWIRFTGESTWGV